MRKAKQQALQIRAPEEGSPSNLQRFGGSVCHDLNTVLISQVCNAAWVASSDEEQRLRQLQAIASAMAGIAPRDALEGMLAAQMVATHNASMECLRRSMLNEQTLEGRKENLNQANKLSRTYATLLEALSRHRGKGQQKVTVEHVHVHSGGQAIVGNVTLPGGGGVLSGNSNQPHAKALPRSTLDASLAPLRSQDEVGESLPVAGDAERAV